MAKTKTKTTASEQDVLIVTQAGYDALVQELNHRKDVVRVEIANEISQARDLGDLSENQAYASAMEKKEMNDARIDELDYLISIAQITDASQQDDVVAIGHTVDIQKIGGEKRTIVLVGKAETGQASPAEGKISIDSPIGRAINMSRVGDIVDVKLPKGDVKYKILKIAA